MEEKDKEIWGAIEGKEKFLVELAGFSAELAFMSMTKAILVGIAIVTMVIGGLVLLAISVVLNFVLNAGIPSIFVGIAGGLLIVFSMKMLGKAMWYIIRQ